MRPLSARGRSMTCCVRFRLLFPCRRSCSRVAATCAAAVTIMCCRVVVGCFSKVICANLRACASNLLYTLSTGPSKEDVDVEVSFLLDGDHPITKLKLRARSGLLHERRALKWALRGSKFHPEPAERHRARGDSACTIITSHPSLCFEECHQPVGCEVHAAHRMPVHTHSLNTRLA